MIIITRPSYQKLGSFWKGVKIRMGTEVIRKAIEDGKVALGIEMGSTRIKGVLIGPDHKPIASGSHDWENRLEDGIWTYHLDDVWAGVQDCYRNLAAKVQETYGVALRSIEAIGISAMMHGYLAFDANGKQLAQFRTWRNTTTEQAAKELTELFQFNIPLRWSISHLYQAILNGESHVPQVAFITTLAGYVHWMLTGKKVLGVGDASGMFPIDSTTNDYDAGMIQKFDGLIAGKGYPWKVKEILPKVLCAGDAAGVLTEEGAKLLDPTGTLCAGIPLCPPEGDAGTGMTATNSVAERRGNISAGTSIFAMAVLEKPLSAVYPEIDMVTTPDGKPVAMVHCNNCSSDIDAWAGLFQQFGEVMGVKYTMPQVLDAMFYQALEGDKDCGGLVAYNYFSGEPITKLEEGRPMVVRMPDAKFNFANFARVHLYSAMAALKIGMDILFGKENVRLDMLLGHGGFFKAKGVGQKLMAAAMGTPVSVMETAGEGGPWGIALLAAYLVRRQDGESLGDYLEERVFAGSKGESASPDPEDQKGFEAFMAQYVKGLAAERAAVDQLK